MFSFPSPLMINFAVLMQTLIFFKNSFFPYCVWEWNKLDPSIRNSASISTLGVETFAWRNFCGKRNAQNFVHFAWINFRGWTQHENFEWINFRVRTKQENFALINFHEIFSNGKCFLFNITEG